MAHLSSDLHIDQPLSDLAVAYMSDPSAYLWQTLLPIKATDKRSNFIRGVNRANLLRRHELRVGNRGASVPRVRFKMDASQSYNCSDLAVECLNDDREEAEADSIVQYVPENLRHLVEALNIGLEYYVIKDTLRNTSVITNYTDLSGTTRQYDLLGSPDSNPIPHWRQIVTNMRHQTGGSAPNSITLSTYTWQKIQENLNTLALGRLEGYNSAYSMAQNVENMIGVAPGTIKESTAVYNSATEDDGTETLRTFIGPDVIFAYSQPPSIRNFGLGFMFAFAGASTGPVTQLPDGINTPFAVLSVRDWLTETLAGGTKMRIIGGVDAKVLNPNAAYLIKNAINGADTDKYNDWLKA